MKTAGENGSQRRAQSGPRQPGARLQCGSTTAQGIHNPLGKRLYTLKEAATYLGRSEWGMRDLKYSGKIPFVKVNGGRKDFFDICDLDDFIEKHKDCYLT
jgi:hypothetical protein